MQSFLVSIVPSAGAIFLFWLALRAVFQADRRERAAIARYEAEHAPAVTAAATSDPTASSGPTPAVGAPARAPADGVADTPDGDAPRS